MSVIYLISFVLASLSLSLCLMAIFVRSGTRESKEINSRYECGFEPLSGQFLPLSLQFFLVSVIFLIFDVEVSVILPATFLADQNFILSWLLGGLVI